MRLLNLPLPILTAVFVPQLEPPQVTTPGYIAAAMGGAWLVLWYLQQIGKLPGAPERRASDQAVTEKLDVLADQVDAVHKIVTREDADAPGWPMVWRSMKESREVRDAVTKLAALAEVWVKDREEWRRDKAELQERITRLEDVNRRQERALEKGAG